MALELYSKNKLDRLEWPSYSPDLNPIENVWGIVKQQIKKWDLSKISEVIAKVKEIWSELDQEVIENVIQNMPFRLNKMNWVRRKLDWLLKSFIIVLLKNWVLKFIKIIKECHFIKKIRDIFYEIKCHFL